LDQGIIDIRHNRLMEKLQGLDRIY